MKIIATVMRCYSLKDLIEILKGLWEKPEQIFNEVYELQSWKFARAYV
jgi:hypothetical protein